MAFAAAASAAKFKVTVGNNGALKYEPNNTVAAVGDSVEFDFFPKNHTVTQSSFADPCHFLPGGFFSGFVPTTDATLGSSFTITVTDTKPIWFYCSQTTGNHCQQGMVGSINAPATGNTLSAFAAKAKNATVPSTFPPPGSSIGGTLIKSTGNSTSNGTSTGSGSGSGSGSSSSYTSTYTTSYSTSATIVTSVSSTYTSNGATYTTAVPSTYTTAYTTAKVTTATGVTAVGTGSSSSPSQITTSAAAGGFSANMILIGAVVLGALAMV